MILGIFSNGLEGFPLLLIVIGTLIWLVALTAIANGKFYDNTTKLCWFFLVLLLNLLGVLLFIFWGRRQVTRVEQKL